MSFHETYQYSRQAVIDYARAIESLGYDTLWITENVHSGADSLEPLLTLSFMAAHTERIKFGPSVILLPLRNAVGLAHAVATLDRLSEGRLILGVGNGGTVPAPLKPTARPSRQRGRYSDEALEVMKSLWTGDPVTFSGKLLDLDSYSPRRTPDGQTPTRPSGSGGRGGRPQKGPLGSPTASSPTASARAISRPVEPDRRPLRGHWPGPGPP